MGALLQDVRYALRVLWKQPGFTAVALLAVALSIGANTTIFSAVDVLLLRPFAFEKPEEVYFVWERNPQSGLRRGSVSPANFLDLRAQVKTLENLSAFGDTSFNLSDGDKPERVQGTTISPALFSIVGAKPQLGRTFTAEEEEPGKSRVVVISDGLWRRRFAGDAKVVGRELSLNGQSYTVIGVMPPKFNFPPNGGDIWQPLSFDAAEAKTRGNHYLRVLGRLKDGTTPEQVSAEISNVARQLAQAYPDTNAARTFGIESISANYTRGPRAGLTVLLGAVAFVLLLACANVANLLLVRASARQKEIAIRMAMGANRLRLVRQLLTESVVLSLAGGALGVFLAVWGVALVATGIPQSLSKYLPGWENIGVNLRALFFTLAVSVLTGLIFGLAPALQATKTNFNEALKDGGRTSGGQSRNRLRSLLVVSEITLSLVLLVGAGLMIRSFVGLLKVEPGFNPASVVVMDIGLEGKKYDDRAARVNFYQQLLRKIESLPGVSAAGAVNFAPLSRSNSSSSFTIEGRPPLRQGEEMFTDWRPSSPGYTEAMNIPLKRGRRLSDADDRADAPRALLINERMAERFFAGEDPVGKRLDLGDGAKNGYWEIVGVVGNVKHEGLDEEQSPEVYAPYAKAAWRGMTVAVRTSNDPAQVVSAVQHELRGLDRDQPVFNVRTMDRVVSESLAPQRVTTWLLVIFAAIALVLAGIGIYAVMSYTVAQRTHEIGVRMALGAQPRDILSMIVRQGMLLTAAGLALGLVASLVVTRGMTKILYGVKATDPATFVAISILLTLVALAAHYFPARRATKVDPLVALRYE
jgi:putative ABC transport system permease protein